MSARYLTAFELYLFQLDTLTDAGALLYNAHAPGAEPRLWTLEDDDDAILTVCPTDECAREGGR